MLPLRKRPLFFICIFLISSDAVLVSLGVFPLNKNYPDCFPSEKCSITLQGRIYKCSDTYYYLNNIYLGGAHQNCTVLLQRNSFNSDSFFGSSLSVGNTIEISGTYKPYTHATNPGEFDSYDYYSDLGIYGSITDWEVLSNDEHIFPVRNSLMKLWEYWNNRIYSIYPEKEASVMSDLLLGNKSGVDKDIMELYRRNGISHILSISGLHISILGLGLAKLLNKLGLGKNKAGLAGGLLLVFYCLLTGLCLSSIRAVGMYIISLLGDMLGRTSDRLTSLGLLALLILIGRPTLIRNCGFLLSFCAGLGIIIIYPALQQLFSKISPETVYYEEEDFKQSVKKLLSQALRRLKSSLLGSLSIVLSTLPVQLTFFYEVPVYSVILNLIILPLMSAVMISGFISMLIPGMGILGTPAYLLISFYTWLCNLFDKLPFHTWNPGKPQAWQICLYIAIISLMLFVIYNPLKLDLVYITYKNRIFLTFFAIFSAIYLLGLSTLTPGTFIFLDVDQGDCCLIYTPAKKLYIIDGGSSGRSNIGEYVIYPALKYYGLSHIDGIFVSHSDKDHCNGIAQLVENKELWNLKIDGIYLPGCHYSESSEYFTYFLSSDVPVYYLSAGDTWQSGSYTFTCLHPSSNYIAEDTNSSSECILVTHNETNVLFVGDIDGSDEYILSKALAMLAPNGITVLKVAHHGSRYSSTMDFLTTAAPEYCIISAGKNNRYNHPHEETIYRLESIGSTILSTAARGAIIFSI